MSSRKRIIIISENLAEPWDEGIKKFAYSIGTALSSHHDVRMINVDRAGVYCDAAVRCPGTKTFLNPALRRLIQEHSPNQLIYVPTASVTSAAFLRAFALRRFAPGAAIGVVGLMPRQRNKAFDWFIRLAAPDVVFVPSYRSLLVLKRLSVPAEMVPVGFDPDRFQPPTGDEKEALRERYAIDQNSMVFLHVGHLSPRRNLLALSGLVPIANSEVIVVGSTSTAEDLQLHSALEHNGVRVIREYVPIHEFYKLSDCYVFPVEDSDGSVEMPLSVLEALASGLPVLSKPFGGLRDFLPEGEDIRYWHTNLELVRAAERVSESLPVTVRSMASFSWEAIADRITNTLGEAR